MAYGQEIGTCIDQCPAVLRRDPANRDAGNFEQAAPPFKDIRIRAMFAGLRFAGEEAAECNVIRALLTRLHRKVAAGMASHADLRVPPKRFARLGDVTVTLAQMEAIGLQPFGQGNGIVDDECDIPLRADCLERLSQARRLMLVDVFYPELEGGNRTGIQSPCKQVGEGARHCERRNQVKLAICHRFALSEPGHRAKLDSLRAQAQAARMNRFAIPVALLALTATSGCLRYNIDNSVAHARLGQVAVLGDVSIAPIEVLEDSRCPETVQCVWAGQLVVSANVTDRGSSKLRELTLSETFVAGGRTIEFFSARPKAEENLKPLIEDYRFGFRSIED